jgi:hypothetical protein
VEEQKKLETEIKYESLRTAARDATRFRLTLGRIKLPGVNFERMDFIHISDVALNEAAGWNFPWRRIVGQTRPYLRRFEVAIWQNGTLLALAVGRCSRGPDNLTIHYLERLKDNNPLASYVSLIVADMAENYAKLLRKQRVKLKNPSDGLIIKYESLGFSLAEFYRGATYYDRRVQP